MNKEYLEAFYKIKDFGPVGYTLEEYNELIGVIEQALQRLEAIDNANSDANEALNCLVLLGDFEWHNKPFKECLPVLFNTIKEYILKSQELESDNSALLEENNDLYIELTFGQKQYKELTEYAKQCTKLLELITRKNVDVRYFKQCNTLNDYNYCQRLKNRLSQEEFNLLKEWL